MMPTFSPSGDLVLVEHMSQEIRRDDIVIAVSPTDPTHTVCKRVVGLEGDEISVRRYPLDRIQQIEIPKGRCWLEGDNASNSTDSRSYGPVPLAMIKGKVFFRVWPLTQFGVIR
jgi:signal peptidase I